MGYFPVRYDSRVVIYERKMFIRLTTGEWHTEFSQLLFFKWAIPGVFFFIFLFSIHSWQFNIYNFLPMTGFKPWTSGIVSNCSTNWATTTAHSQLLLMSIFDLNEMIIRLSRFQKLAIYKMSGVKGAIAQWVFLRLPLCGPGFKSEAIHLCFIQLAIKLWCEKNKDKQKEARIVPHFTKNVFCNHNLPL